MKESRIRTEIFEAYRLKNNLTKKRFCEMCGISESVYRKILRQQFNFDAKSLFKIARVVNIKICEIFEGIN